MHSPLPWRIVRDSTPYGDWIMDATGGMVCIGFGKVDEQALLASPRLLDAIEHAAVAFDQGHILRARAILGGILEEIRSQ